ncbi:MAG: hypothetical protein RIK87_04050 [Fuerstiella sp.]
MSHFGYVHDRVALVFPSENLATGIDIGIGMIGGGLDDFGRSLLRNGYKEGATAAVKNSAVHAAKFMSVEAGATVAAGAYGYYSNGNSWDAAIRYGAFGSVTGGLAAHRFVKCFTAGTPVAVGLTHKRLISATHTLTVLIGQECPIYGRRSSCDICRSTDATHVLASLQGTHA